MKYISILICSLTAAAQVALAEDPQNPPATKSSGPHANAPAPRSAAPAPRAPQSNYTPQRNYLRPPQTAFNGGQGRFDRSNGLRGAQPIQRQYRPYNQGLPNPTRELRDTPAAARTLPATNGATADLTQPTTSFPRTDRAGRAADWRRRGGPAVSPSATATSPTTNDGQQPSINAGSNDWRNRAGSGSWRNRDGSNGTNGTYTDAWRRYHHDHHDRNWWRSNHDRIVLFGGGYYYWDTGFWYPAWGYDPAYSNYAYDGPIYGYDGLAPDQVISSVQGALQEEGYYRGAVDGELGPLTREALAAWQRDHGLAITTVIDEPTMQSLGLR